MNFIGYMEWRKLDNIQIHIGTLLVEVNVTRVTSQLFARTFASGSLEGFEHPFGPVDTKVFKGLLCLKEEILVICGQNKHATTYQICKALV